MMRYEEPMAKIVSIESEEIIRTSGDLLTNLVGVENKEANYIGNSDGVNIFES